MVASFRCLAGVPNLATTHLGITAKSVREIECAGGYMLSSSVSRFAVECLTDWLTDSGSEFLCSARVEVNGFGSGD